VRPFGKGTGRTPPFGRFLLLMLETFLLVKIISSLYETIYENDLFRYPSAGRRDGLGINRQDGVGEGKNG
jgi:hypothetical protein